MDEQFSEAHYWYRRAAAAGYGLEDYLVYGELERPVVALDCCPAIRERAAQEKTTQIIAATNKSADRLRRRAREDVKVIVDAARNEVDQLALQYQSLAEQIVDFQDSLEALSKIASRRRSAGRYLVWLLLKSKFSPQTRRSVNHLYAMFSLAADMGSGQLTRPEFRRRRSTWRTVVGRLVAIFASSAEGAVHKKSANQRNLPNRTNQPESRLRDAKPTEDLARSYT
jgi:hypothetical protein